MKFILPYLKAHFAALGAAYVVLQADLANNVGHDLGSLTGYQWVGVIGAALGLGAVVAATPNADKPAPAPVEVAAPSDVEESA